MASAKSSRRNSQVSRAPTRSGSVSSKSSSDSSSTSSSASSTSKASSRSPSMVSVESGVIDDLIRRQVRYADKPDGLPTGLFGLRRDSWDSFTSDNSVDLTSHRLKARHHLEESYQRKLTPALQKTMQAFAPQDKSAMHLVDLRNTPKSPGQGIDNLRYFSDNSKARFTRTVTKRNCVIDSDGRAAARLDLNSGARDKYRIASIRHCKSAFHLGEESLFDSIQKPAKFVHNVRKAIPDILKTQEAGLKGRGIGGREAGIKSKSRYDRQPNATEHKQELKTIYNAPAIKLTDKETYDLDEDDKPYGIKDAKVMQNLEKFRKGKAVAGEDYEETLQNTGSKIVRSTEHVAVDQSMNASAVILDAIRIANRAGAGDKRSSRPHKARVSSTAS